MGVPQFPMKTGDQIAELGRKVRRLEIMVRTPRGGLPGSVVGGINPYPGSHVLALVDIGRLAQMNSNSANNLTLPGNATAAISVGSSGRFVQYGAGLLTVVAAVGVTIRSASGMHVARDRYSVGNWLKTGLNEYLLFGDLTA